MERINSELKFRNMQISLRSMYICIHTLTSCPIGVPIHTFSRFYPWRRSKKIALPSDRAYFRLDGEEDEE